MLLVLYVTAVLGAVFWIMLTWLLVSVSAFYATIQNTAGMWIVEFITFVVAAIDSVVLSLMYFT